MNMNPLCKVCGDLAAGFHFGVFTCEGCKSFFGRACKKSQVIPECRKKTRCIINKTTRTTCKACRLAKCLDVGMSKNGSKFGRRSNWFKHKLLLEEQQPSHEQPIDAYDPGTIHVNPYQTQSRSAALPLNINQLTQLAGHLYLTPAQLAFHHSLIEGVQFKDLTNFYVHQQYLMQHQRQLMQQYRQEQRNDGQYHNNSLEDIDEDIDITDEDDQNNPMDLSLRPPRAAMDSLKRTPVLMDSNVAWPIPAMPYNLQHWP